MEAPPSLLGPEGWAWAWEFCYVKIGSHRPGLKLGRQWETGRVKSGKRKELISEEGSASRPQSMTASAGRDAVSRRLEPRQFLQSGSRGLTMWPHWGQFTGLLPFPAQFFLSGALAAHHNKTSVGREAVFRFLDGAGGRKSTGGHPLLNMIE